MKGRERQRLFLRHKLNQYTLEKATIQLRCLLSRPILIVTGIEGGRTQQTLRQSSEDAGMYCNRKWLFLAKGGGVGEEGDTRDGKPPGILQVGSLLQIN